MKKFKVTVPCDYFQGHLRYGHGEAIIEAESIEEARKKAKDFDGYDLIVDDYEIEDHDSWDIERMTIEEMTESSKEKRERLLDFEELSKIDLTEYVQNRDGADYINWAVVVELLHKYGAKKVYFEPLTNESGSSLFMSEQTFIDSKGNTNRVYETAVRIVIDDLDFVQRGPVTNGANPVKDNSMTQQRLWNCQTRLFVKGVAIRTGLGFSLWSRFESEDEAKSIEPDINIHDISKIKERTQVAYTNLIKKGMTVKEIADKLHKTEDEVKALFSYYDTLNTFETDLINLDK